jgi:hypothetical protein
MPGKNTGGNKKVGGSLLSFRRSPKMRRAAGRAPDFDQFGLESAGKYRSLGPRNRLNVARAIREGFVYNTTSGTTEEQCCYGELRRRGFEVGEQVAPRWFVPQYPLAGEIVDFAGGNLGQLFALRPNNAYWHGHATEKRNQEEGAENLEELGYEVFDIIDADTLSDTGIESRFNLFFGRS